MHKLFILLMLIAGYCSAQITLEHSYPNGSTMVAVNGPNDSIQPLMVNLEIDGYKYVIINRGLNKIDLYNMNHTLFKSISITLPDSIPASIVHVQYISQSLFNQDPKIEFLVHCKLYSSMGSIWNFEDSYYTWIINEDNNLLFSEFFGAPIVKYNLHQQQFPIYSTPEGTKMILSMTNQNANIYSLPGSFVTSLSEKGAIDDENILFDPFPNPTNGLITIPYNLSDDVEEATVFLFDQKGVEVKKIVISNQKKSFSISVSEFNSGIYTCQLMAGQSIVKKQIIKIE